MPKQHSHDHTHRIARTAPSPRIAMSGEIEGARKSALARRQYHARRAQALLALAMAITPMACSATGSREKLSPIIAQNARPLKDADARTATVFEDRLVFPLSSQAWLSEINAGDVLVSGYETGFLRLVKSLETTADSIVVYTDDASLTDIVEQGETETTIPYSDLQPAALHENPGYSPQAMTSDSIVFQKDLTGMTLDLGDGIAVRFNKGSFSFTPSLDVRLAVSGFKVQEARAIANGALHADFEVEIEGSAAYSTTPKEKILWRSSLFSVPLPPIGGVPVTCSGELVVKAGFTFDAQGQVHVTLSQAVDFDGSLGFQYDDSGFSGVHTFEPSFGPAQVPEVAANVDVKATGYLVGTVRLGFYGFSKLLKTGADVELSAKPSILYHYASTDPAPGWGLDAALKVETTPALRILSKTLASKTFTLWENESNPMKLLPMADEPAPIDPGDCADGQEDGLETGVDCGGQCATACSTGEGCVTDADCVTGACVNSECAGASCQNGVEDGGEQGVDCGGPCAECAGGSCADDSDCIGANCVDGVCEQPLSCEDGEQSEDETGIDCGGPCPPCGDWAENCNDGQLNGDEEGVDCGGSCVPCEGGGATCDGTGDCNACAACADQGACASLLDACGANPECYPFWDCYSQCADQACVDDCAAMYPGGQDDYFAYASCVTCSECYSDCDGASVCQ